MVTQFDETGAKPASLLLAQPEDRLLPALRSVASTLRAIRQSAGPGQPTPVNTMRF
jgi:hypothetical protein